MRWPKEVLKRLTEVYVLKVHFTSVIFFTFIVRFLFSDYQSAFAIYRVWPTYNSSTDVLIFPSTSINLGNHYDTTTGQFIAQYAGMYVFILNLYKGTRAGSVWCYIRKNGSNIALAYVPAESESGRYESSGSTVVHLDPGDKVDVGSCYNPGYIFYYTSFIGFLLHADAIFSG